jgi:hypothetical protein
VVRDSIFTAALLRATGTDPGARTAIISGVHHLSATAAGGDGFGQGEVKNDQFLNPNDQVIPNDSISKPAGTRSAFLVIWAWSFFPESFRG